MNYIFLLALLSGQDENKYFLALDAKQKRIMLTNQQKQQTKHDKQT